MATQEKLCGTQRRRYKAEPGKIMKRLLFAVYTLALPFMVSGCATAPGSSTQNISIQTRGQSGAEVIGASCELENNAGKWFVTTPGSVTIHRSNDNLQISCTKGSLAPGQATVVPGARGAMFGNVILGGGIGAIFDRNDGSAYEYQDIIPIVMGGFSKIESIRVLANQQNDLPPSMTTDISRTHLSAQANEKEVEGYQKAAAQGNADAQYMLGLAYATGEGVPKDAAYAVEWYQKAAVQGNAAAQYMLGLIYATGKGVPKDAAMAASWYTKAAAQGNAAAQYNLGMAYANSEGVTRDLVRAYAWFDLAAAQGNKDAKKMRDSLAKNITYAQIAEGQRLASSWKKGDTL